MVNKTFDKLFSFLLEKDLVPLGMYRLPYANDNKYPYVSTNPVPSCPITMHDRVFVLGSNIGRDLIVDFNKDEDLPNLSKSKKGAFRMDADHDQSNLKGRGFESDFYGTKKGFAGSSHQMEVINTD